MQEVAKTVCRDSGVGLGEQADYSLIMGRVCEWSLKRPFRWFDWAGSYARSPRILLASWMSFGMMVTLLA